MIYMIFMTLHQFYNAMFELQHNTYSPEICEALEVFRPINQDVQTVQVINVTGLIRVNTWKLSEAVLYGISSTYIDNNTQPISESLNAAIPYFAYYTFSEPTEKSSARSCRSDMTL